MASKKGNLRLAKAAETEINGDQFIIAASDAKGHSERLWTRLQPMHASAVSAIVESKRFPYRTKGDLFRHAIMRHLSYLTSIEEVTSTWQQVDAIIELMRDDQLAEEFMSTFELMNKRIAAHMGTGADGEARALLLKVTKHIEAMPKGYWKRRYKDELRQRFGHLLKNAPKAGLGEFAEEDEED